MESKKTLVIGASLNPDRFSYKAIILLQKFGHQVEAIGVKSGIINTVEIQKGFPLLHNIHTITLYINPQNQVDYYEYILNFKPERIIFNPRTENNNFMQLAREAGIEIVEDCTLVMLNSGRY
jgi:predicted CoA-binding protein